MPRAVAAVITTAVSHVERKWRQRRITTSDWRYQVNIRFCVTDQTAPSDHTITQDKGRRQPTLA